MIDLMSQGIKNDLVIQDGDLVLVDGADQIQQAIIENLQTFFGEWFLNTTIGVPYFQVIFVKVPNLDLIQLTLTNIILSTPGVAQLNSFSLDYTNSNRTLSITFEAKTTNGQIIKAQTQVGN
jgi:hypothetical protein